MTSTIGNIFGRQRRGLFAAEGDTASRPRGKIEPRVAQVALPLFAKDLSEIRAGRKNETAIVNRTEREVDEGIETMIRGVDKGVFQAPSKIVNTVTQASLRALGDVPVVSRVMSILGGLTRTVTDIARHAIVASAHALAQPIVGFGKAIVSIVKGDWRQAGKIIWNDIIAGPALFVPQLLTDTLATAVAAFLSAIGVASGWESKGRGLSADEKANLRSAFGDSVDLDVVQIKRGGANTLGAGARTIGDTIYLADDDKYFRPDGALTHQGWELITHEMGHVWQHQNGGDGYIHQAVWSYLTEGTNKPYDFIAAMRRGTLFDELTPDQQAEIIRTIVLWSERGHTSFAAYDRPSFSTYQPKRGPLTQAEADYLNAAWEAVRKGHA